ncbi:MAG TPA: family 43 glycosylhydrolase [Verrucomicrobiota bacterium]|nr:family 43 glycosylhydrolase [Verrucomicrobiota bacterium]
MKTYKFFVLLLTFALFCCSLFSQQQVVKTQNKSNRLELPNNPLFIGADPHCAIFNGVFWIYPTSAATQFYAYCSSNLFNWKRVGPVLDFKDVKWIYDDGQKSHFAWAPCIAEKSGNYYFYYSVGPQNPTPSRIGVAVGKTPSGPFVDSGKPLLIGDKNFEAIDPMVFIDPVSKKALLYAGGSAGSTLRVFELSPEMINIIREIPVVTPPNFTEGVFMHFYKGKYYLSYSHGSWMHSSYSVHYAISDTLFGPWNYKGAILQSDATRKGPGHHSFVFDDATKQWLIFYHRWDNFNGDGPYKGFRSVCVEEVKYDKDGLIIPIKMTGVR